MYSAVTSVGFMSQPTRSQSGFTFVDHVYTPSKICKGAELATDAAADGVLAVHLIDDPEGTWYLMPLEKGKDKGRIFDLVGDSTHGTTLADAETKVVLFLE